MTMEKASIQFEAEENKLLKAAEGYKGVDNIREQLEAEAMTDGFSSEEAKAVVDQVIKRLSRTESGNEGGAFGVAHQPEKQHNNLAKFIAGLRSW